MATQVEMLSTYADPEKILHKGKHYRVSDEFAAALLKEGSGDTEKMSAARESSVPRAKLSRPDPKPDPGETETPEEEDYDDGDPD